MSEVKYPVGVRPKPVRTRIKLLEPFGEFGLFQPELIINTGNRPWSMFGRVVADLGGGRRIIGSGSLIGRQHVLTASHCLWDYRGRAQKIWFIPGYRKVNGGDVAPHGTFEGRVPFSHPDTYKPSKPDPRSDYAVFSLTEKVPAELGFVRPVAVSDSALKSYELTICGVPDDPGPNIDFWKVSGKIKSGFIQERTFFHKLDTRKGMSGSGVCYRDGEKVYLVGVHLELQQKTNQAVRMTQKGSIDNIKYWMK